jgi:hypothetical protein
MITPKRLAILKIKYEIVKEVPMIRWKELVPYWAAICRAIFEVLIENDFHPYTATLKRPKGFVASSKYWEKSLENPTKIPLSDARYFVFKLKEKQYFVKAIQEFNKKIQKNWLEEKNIHILGGYLYSFYYTLKPVLKVERKGKKNYLKPVIGQKEGEV